MIATQFSGLLLVAIGIIATVLTIIAGVAVVSVFRGTRSQQLTSAQSQALDALNTELSAQSIRGDRLEQENTNQAKLLEQQEKRITTQDAQIKHLNEMVTQVAKVDALTMVVKNGFKAVGVPEEVLMRGVTAPSDPPRRRVTDLPGEGTGLSR